VNTNINAQPVFCPYCGGKATTADKNCPHCGESLED
jgi:predicted amidophosphoribosyltransferase